MAKFTPGETFEDGQQVNAARLNNHVASAVPLDGLIADLEEMPTGVVQPDDCLMILDSSQSQLRKIQRENLLSQISSLRVFELNASINPDTDLHGPLIIGQNAEWINIGNAGDGNSIPYYIRLDNAGGGQTGSGFVEIYSNNIEVKTAVAFSGNAAVGAFDIAAFAVPKLGMSFSSFANGYNFLQIPNGSTSLRTTSAQYAEYLENQSFDYNSMAGLVYFNTTSSRLEYHNGTEWKSTLQQDDLRYKTYKRNYTYPGLTSWTLPPYQWENSTNITIPSGETWTYEWEYVIPKNHDSLSSYNMPKLMGYFVVYNDTVEVKAVPIYANYGVGPISIYVSKSLTSLDTPTARKFRVRLEKRDGNGNTGDLPAADGTVTLTIRPTSDDTFVANNL